ncbi:ribosomal protein S18-alanine N-acetyltransferase [Bradymonas sediminis]|uniref:Ribosomal-protein-alanine N-acetyltransferase n=1 Tax=Bradymonas sediminis TaxID=1548548 RepID=A0A2Z4FJN3_9DELT|nr:ribosomal protein S18-alanine N-acetyltransferase [Bradymonas sediminis]AWV89132.1 ribosomal-protein-alanine N-acetyltransferase [Bradymonas sediminis]TDP64402.1 [SSU ribosomal protein S18P]-alanine acetyltransferase [Bradymonas sediminis]
MSWQIGPKLGIRAQADAPAFVRARKATTSDIDAILQIEEAAHPTAWPRKIFEGELELDCSSVWVFERATPAGDEQGAREIVGFLVYWLIHDEVHILNVAVAPRARRQGIASAVIGELIRVSHQNLASFVTLEVRINNQAAISLYESLGFVIIGQRPGYYADTGEDALIMSHLLG